MTDTYRPVQWNRHKWVYDGFVMAGVLFFVVAFVAVTKKTHPAPHDLGPAPVLLMRATASCAFVMLNLILVIGPLARLSPKFAPLLYNRRHLGVAMFSVAAVHAIIATLFYHGLGNANPIIGIFTDNTRYDSIAQFPFQTLGFAAFVILFVMASTSHDFWLKNLGPPFWKALHMLVYVAYVLLVLHVILGALQSEKSPVYVVLVTLGLVAVVSLHLLAGFREVRADAQGHTLSEWVSVGKVDDIVPDRGLVVCLEGEERVAVYRYDNKVSAVSNVCSHQNGPLGEGKIVDGCLTCPWHGYQFLVDKGQSPPPFTEKIPTYRVKIVAGEIFLDPCALPPGTPVEPAEIEVQN
jgi:sulfoxide reductase heme-binding subunit YedZ